MVGALPETRSHGGDGSDVEENGAPVVPFLDEDDDEVQGDESNLVVRWTATACTRTA